MADNGNKQRPARKLIVDNFSVIKHAELEFGKITVLIGPQASGKSLLCKLAYFLSSELVELAAESIANNRTWDHFIAFLPTEFQGRFFLAQGVVANGTELAFISGSYEVVLRWMQAVAYPQFTFSETFKQAYEAALSKGAAVAKSVSGLLLSEGPGVASRWHEALFELNSVVWGSAPLVGLYVPANRVFFSNLAKQTEALKNVGLDSITRSFAGQITWDGGWKAGILTSGRGITDEINRSMTDILGGFVIADSSVPRFLNKNGGVLPLEALSTGTQEMIPLFNVIERLAYIREHLIEMSRADHGRGRAEEVPISTPFVYLEEPEANVFPKTQYDLVKLFAWLSNDTVLDFHWVITTHSPYILSAFGNLIKAGQVAQAGPDKAEAAKRVVPERYWIDPGDFHAYALKPSKSDPGKFETESIIDDNTGQIDGDYLDDVSSEIAEEFTQLLELQYGG